LRTVVAILSGSALLMEVSAPIASASASPEPEVRAKLDTILLFMAVGDSGQPMRSGPGVMGAASVPTWRPSMSPQPKRSPPASCALCPAAAGSA